LAADRRPAHLTNARSHLGGIAYASAIESIQTRHFTHGHLKHC
jgi:hypothetical protein